MSVTFRDYLDAKLALDELSLNPAVREAFIAALGDRSALVCLDLGAGSGATIWRLLNAGFTADLGITVVERDPELLDLAFRRAATLLSARDYTVNSSPGYIRAQRGRRNVSIEFVAADLEGFEHDRLGYYDAVTAHSVMDLLPPRIMAGRIAGWLKPGGVFYATVNYDGGTALFPEYSDQPLEDRLLAVYDASMEQRRVWGQPSGGARSGRRLHSALQELGFDVLAYGSSDWNVVPLRHNYRDSEAICLGEIVELIRREADKSGQFSSDDLDGWYRARLLQIDAGQLGLIVHQIDLIAEKPSWVTL